MHVVLAVTQHRNDWDFQARQESHEFGEAAGILARAVCHNGKLPVSPVNLCDQQQISDEPGGKTDVDCRRQYRYQDTVGFVSQFMNIGLRDGRRCIDDDGGGLIRYA